MRTHENKEEQTSDTRGKTSHMQVNATKNCVKSTLIWSFSGPYIPAFRTVFSPSARKYVPEKLLTQTPFTQWKCW